MNEDPFQPVALRDFHNGLVQESVVSEFMLPEGTVSKVKNLNFDVIGAAKVRDGVTIIGAQIVDNKTIVGLHQFLDQGAGTDDKLIAVCNTVAYYWSGSAWTSKRTGLTADSKARFTNFVDLVFMVNGVDAMNSWDGAAANSFGTTNCVSAPAARFIDNFRTRVWAANSSTYPSRLWYSSVADVSGGIVWTGDDSGYIDISPGDGEDITGIQKFSQFMLVFKRNYTYRVYSKNDTEPDPYIFVGTYSQESVKLAKDGVYWHHPSGIYRLRRGDSYPREISKPVQGYINAVSRSYYESVSSWTDDDHVYFSIGDVTVDGETIANCVLRWTISTEVWTVYSYAHEFRIGATYDTGSALVTVVGDDDGNVHTFNSGVTDNGTPIYYSMETQPYTLSGLRSDVKIIKRLCAISDGLTGAYVGYRPDNEQQSIPIGALEGDETIFKETEITGRRIRFNINGVSDDGAYKFNGFEIIDWLSEGLRV